MTRKKVIVTEIRERCPICNRSMKDVVRHVAMKGNLYVTNNPDEPHVKWRREHGLPEGYINGELGEIIRAVKIILKGE